MLGLENFHDSHMGRFVAEFTEITGFSGIGDFAVDDIAVSQGLVVDAVVCLSVSPLELIFSMSLCCLL